MKRLITALSLGIVLSVPFAASAQTAPAGPNPTSTMSPDQMAKTAQIRSDSKTAVMKAISPAHAVAVQSIIDQLNANKIDPRAAVTQIDGILSPEETSAVLAVGAKMRTDMRNVMASSSALGANAATPAPNEQRGEGVGRRAQTAGGVILGVMLTPAQMNAIRAAQPAPRAT